MRIKARKSLEIGQRVRPCDVTFSQKVEMFHILGAAFPPHAPIEVKFSQPNGPGCPSAVPSFTSIGAIQ